MIKYLNLLNTFHYFSTIFIVLGMHSAAYSLDEICDEFPVNKGVRRKLKERMPPSKRNRSESAILSLGHAPDLAAESPRPQGDEVYEYPSDLSLLKKHRPKPVVEGIDNGGDQITAIQADVTPTSLVPLSKDPGESTLATGNLDIKDSNASALNMNERARQFLTSKHVSDKDILKASIINELLHVELRQDPSSKLNGTELDLSLVPPKLIEDFLRIGGTRDELMHDIQLVKLEKPSPIRNPAYKDNGDFYSPAGKVVLGRRALTEGRQMGAIRKLFPEAHTIPQPIISLEQRKEREQLQYQQFLKEELARGKTEVNLKAELDFERELFGEYLNYIKLRKAENGVLGDEGTEADEEDSDDESVLASPSIIEEADVDEVEDVEVAEAASTRIKKSELELKFEEFVGNKMSHLKIEGYDLYFSTQTLDLDRLQKDGNTNRDVMTQLGKIPIGADGKPMNFHHLTHYDAKTHKTKSIIILITDSLHKKCYGLLHFGSQTYRLPKIRVVRQMFNIVRETFNKKIVDSLAGNESESD